MSTPGGCRTYVASAHGPPDRPVIRSLRRRSRHEAVLTGLRPSALLPAGVAIVAAFACAALGDPRAHAIPFVALVLVWGAVATLTAPSVGSPVLIGIVALLVRLPLLTLAPTLSDDVWRYVWEGTVWRAGFDPFVHAPDAAALEHLRDTTWTHVAHRHVPSIYPPLAQALFVVLSGGGVLAWRIFATTCDTATALLLGRASARAGWTWALLPLPALEAAVSGHLEGVGVFLLVLAVTTRSPLAAWLGALVKLLPGVLLALEPPRRWLGWALLTALVTLPVVRPTGFETYRASWAFNGSVFPLAEHLLGANARPLLQLVGVGIVAGILLRSRDPARVALWTTGAFVVLSPTVHPWYVLWPLAAALLAGSRAWIVLAVTVPASYVVLSAYDPATSRWTEWPATRVVVYAPFFAALAWEAWHRLTRPGPSAVH